MRLSGTSRTRIPFVPIMEAFEGAQAKTVLKTHDRCAQIGFLLTLCSHLNPTLEGPNIARGRSCSWDQHMVAVMVLELVGPGLAVGTRVRLSVRVAIKDNKYWFELSLGAWETLAG